MLNTIALMLMLNKNPEVIPSLNLNTNTQVQQVADVDISVGIRIGPERYNRYWYPGQNRVQLDLDWYNYCFSIGDYDSAQIYLDDANDYIVYYPEWHDRYYGYRNNFNLFINERNIRININNYHNYDYSQRNEYYRNNYYRGNYNEHIERHEQHEQQEDNRDYRNDSQNNYHNQNYVNHPYVNHPEMRSIHDIRQHEPHESHENVHPH